MRKMVMGAAIAAGVAALVVGAGLSASVSKETTEEIRIFVIDKAGSAVDVSNWTGAIDVTPVNGTRKAYKLEQATPGMKESLEKGAKDLKDEAKEKFGGAKGEGQDRSKTADSKGMMLCGQAKQLDEWWVEMVVVRPGSGTPAKKGEGVREEGKTWGQGFTHDHKGPYFKANVDETTVKDPKTGTINFKATVVFTMPNGDTKYVKGFEYPEGVYDDAIGRLVDKEFKDTSKLDHEQATMLGRKTQGLLHALPPLSFKSDGDRQEFEKAKQECMSACQNLEQVSGKDIADAADKCKSALKEVRSQAKDAQGALSAD
ncbi:MAG TPA: hypothetical protein VNM14_02275 [Planctomycetota bacterium]|nr:hypothetical protein [Planctomycetota bacterium]